MVSKESKRDNKDSKNQNLNAFLNMAINVEYVFLILTGIIKIMQAQTIKFENRKLLLQRIHILEQNSGDGQ